MASTSLTIHDPDVRLLLLDSASPALLCFSRASCMMRHTRTRALVKAAMCILPLALHCVVYAPPSTRLSRTTTPACCVNSHCVHMTGLSPSNYPLIVCLLTCDALLFEVCCECSYACTSSSRSLGGLCRHWRPNPRACAFASAHGSSYLYYGCLRSLASPSVRALICLVATCPCLPVQCVRAVARAALFGPSLFRGVSCRRAGHVACGIPGT